MIKELPIIDSAFHPDRVLINKRGFGTSSKNARERYGVEPDIIFLQDDGWMLGAPKGFENIAYQTGPGKWTHFVRKSDTEWKPIEEYHASTSTS